MKVVLLDALKEEKEKLSGRSDLLKERYHIISMTSKASELVIATKGRSQEEVAFEANQLKSRIDTFLKAHRPSPKNVKYLRFAKECISQAEQGKSLSTKKVVSLSSFNQEEISKETFELAEQIYTLAGKLYKEEYLEFQEALETFSSDIEEEIYYHIEMCQGDLHKLEEREERIKIVQGILGYAHFLTDYYTGNTPYPSFEEIHEVFYDLAFVNYLEEEETF